MEQARGRITAIHEDRITVEVDSASFCSRCSTGKGCGAGLFGADRGPRQVDVPLPDLERFGVGDEVTLELAPESLLRAALIVYGAPLLAVAVVSLAAVLLGWSDLVSVVVMLAAAVLGITVGRRRLRRSNCLKQFTPVIGGRPGTVR
ncbi:MAG: SoxR reducing system RseC family protein [Woeseiaceae bacterium]|nr:SoxR reducing system RseC family protein [Woeseiaceae bacterium]